MKAAREVEDAPSSKKKKPKKSTAKRIKVAPADYLDRLRSLKGVEKDDFLFFGDDGITSDVTEWIPSGSIAVDRLTGGGWPVGRITEVASWESVGKTTLMDQSLAQVQRMGGIGVLIDSEKARDKAYSKHLGVNLDTLITIPHSDTVEEVFAGIDNVLAVQERVLGEFLAAKRKDHPPLMLIVWDSVGGTPTAAERKGKAGDKHVSDAARVIKQNLRRLTARLPELRVALVCTNHFYTTIGPFSARATYGGSGLRYFPSIRIWLERGPALRIASQDVGHKITAKLKKTRITSPRPPVEIGLLYGAGIDNSFSLFEWGRSKPADGGHQWVVQKGTWYYLMMKDGSYEAFQYGFVGLGQLFQKMPAVYVEMVRDYMETAATTTQAFAVPDGEIEIGDGE